MVNTEQDHAGGPSGLSSRGRIAGSLPSLAAATVLVMALPMSTVANPQAGPPVRDARQTPRAYRMASRQLMLPGIVGRHSGHDVNMIARILNVANREIDIAIELIERDEKTPAVILRHKLARRALLAIHGDRELDPGFIGAMTISSNKPVVAIVNLGPRLGPTGTAIGYNPTHAGGSSILTQNRHGKGFMTFSQLVNFERQEVSANLFGNDGNNNGW